MGLHASFSPIRGQLLLMDPLPLINKVFALISQEEHQRKITNSISSNIELARNMAFAARVDYAKPNNAGQNSSDGYKGQKKDRPFCTHCKIHGHTIDRCFKIHGYPPGYKSKSRENSNFNVHQVTTFEDKADHSGSFGGFVRDLNPNQYRQLMLMFSTHLTNSIKSASDQDVTTYPTEGFPFHTVTSLKTLLDSFPDLVLPHVSLDTSLVSSTAPSTEPHVLLDSSQQHSHSDIVSCDGVYEKLVDPSSFLTPASPVIETLINAQVLRRSGRPIQPPSYLQNYQCSLLTHFDMPSALTSYPLSKYILCPSISLITFCLILIDILFSLYLLNMNHNSIIKQFNFLNGELP
ncbi:hypothetical protein LWI29_011056 [Acer saccharum]|uniref:Uncharacterized protein n=1 Tax=Acer saccharum TaxID=4024 RepID=A0AA39RVS3_ACESA|nr:hypothetical protein LWI29_011056 [Acer saccharum]